MRDGEEVADFVHAVVVAHERDALLQERRARLRVGPTDRVDGVRLPAPLCVQPARIANAIRVGAQRVRVVGEAGDGVHGEGVVRGAADARAGLEGEGGLARRRRGQHHAGVLRAHAELQSRVRHVRVPVLGLCERLQGHGHVLAVERHREDETTLQQPGLDVRRRSERHHHLEDGRGVDGGGSEGEVEVGEDGFERGRVAEDGEQVHEGPELAEARLEGAALEGDSGLVEVEGVDEVRVLGDGHHDDRRVGGLQAEGEREDLLQRDVEEDAHALEGEEGRGELKEAREQRVHGSLLGAQVEGGLLEEEEGVVGLDVVLVDRLVGGVELDAGFGLGLHGEREVEREDGVDHEGGVVEVVHFVEQLAELLGEERLLDLDVQDELIVYIKRRRTRVPTAC